LRLLTSYLARAGAKQAENEHHRGYGRSWRQRFDRHSPHRVRRVILSAHDRVGPRSRQARRLWPRTGVHRRSGELPRGLAVTNHHGYPVMSIACAPPLGATPKKYLASGNPSAGRPSDKPVEDHPLCPTPGWLSNINAFGERRQARDAITATLKPLRSNDLRPLSA